MLRSFGLWAILGWGVTVHAALSAVEPAAKTPPNILFLFADDWGKYASIYASLEKTPGINSVVKTPNIDAVAQRGVVFTQAFVNSPSCTPCRSALLSGRYFFNTGRGAILNNAVWDEKIPTYPLLLRDAGYHIGKSAKVWSPGSPADAPFGKQQYAYQKAGMRFNTFSQQVTAMVNNGQKLEAAKKVIYDQVRGNFQDFLKAKPANKPFHYWFGPTNVHRTWIKGSGKALWKIDPEKLQGKLPPFLPDVPEIREDVADYLGEIQAFDAYIGVILDELEKADLAKNTYVVIAGDHGAPGFPGGKCNLYDFGVNVALIVAGPNIKGGRVVEDFVNLMDLTPTFLDIAAVKHPEKIDGRSILPLLRSTESGRIDATRDYVVTGRERHVGNAREKSLPYPQRALRTTDFLYIKNFQADRWPMGDPYALAQGKPEPDLKQVNNTTRYCFADFDASPTKAWLVQHRLESKWKWFYDYAFAKRPTEELYDLKNDPHQIKNVADHPDYQQVKKKLASRLMTILEKAGDPRVVEKDCRFEKSPYADPEYNPKKKK